MHSGQTSSDGCGYARVAKIMNCSTNYSNARFSRFHDLTNLTLSFSSPISRPFISFALSLISSSVSMSKSASSHPCSDLKEYGRTDDFHRTVRRFCINVMSKTAPAPATAAAGNASHAHSTWMNATDSHAVPIAGVLWYCLQTFVMLVDILSASSVIFGFTIKASPRPAVDALEPET